MMRALRSLDMTPPPPIEEVIVLACLFGLCITILVNYLPKVL